MSPWQRGSHPGNLPPNLRWRSASLLRSSVAGRVFLVSTLWPRGYGPRSVFSARSTALWLVVAFCGSCASAPPRVPPVIQPPLGVTAESILAEPTVDPVVELEALRRSDSAAALLRRSFLELKLGHYQAAIDRAAEVV